MRHAAVIGLCATASMAVGAAQAGAPEARNPFHCSIAFQVSYDLVKAAQGADSELARELHGRLVWQAFAAARFPKAADSEAEAGALARQFSEDSDAGLAMAEACMRRQDAHPEFREARLEKQLREGSEREPLSMRASLDGLKSVYLSAATAAPGRD